MTTRTANGPRITSTIARSPAEATGLIASAQGADATIGVDMAQPVRIAATNDTYRSRQWAFDTLKAETAWRYSVGKGVTVAVVDTGVQSNHPDLAGKVLSGYDVLDRGTPADDAHGHGTHVAGIIAAIANNRTGVAGMTRGARILPVRVLNENGSGDTAGLAEGIRWAADHGANVINLSLAAKLSDTATKSAVAYALSKNIVVVAAAGNDSCGSLGWSPTSYPAAYPGVIGVGSIESNGSKSSFSDCGSWVDLTAPGGRIMSTMIRNSNSALNCAVSSYYCSLSGTSMATPYVAAAAALAIEAIGPTWSQAGVQSVLTGTATDRGAAGRDDRYGYGLVDPVRMLRHVNSSIALSVPSGSIIAGKVATIRGVLRVSDGTTVAGAAVTLSTVLNGRKRSYVLTTNSSGAFSKAIALPHNASFTAVFVGSGKLDKAVSTRSYKLVRPSWSVRHTRSRVYVTNYSRYGQKLALQKKSNGVWKTVKSVSVTRKYWSVTAGKGTWRLHSYANSKLASRFAPVWKN